jgi:hypothetical protein
MLAGPAESRGGALSFPPPQQQHPSSLSEEETVSEEGGAYPAGEQINLLRKRGKIFP